MNGKINYDYLRPKKAEYLKMWHDQPFVCRSELHSYSYTNATILPLRRTNEDNVLFGKGGVVDKNGHYVMESAIEARVKGYYKVDKAVIRNEKVVFCGYLVNHWGHFLAEAVCRLWYFLKKDNSIDKYVFFINENENREIGGNYKEFFKLLGVWEKLEIINKPTTYNEVIVPELSYIERKYYSNEFKTLFEVIANNISISDNWITHKKIFFTRSQLPKASETEFGKEAIDSFFLNNGYTLLSPEKITLSELIFLIRNAEICASVSGTLPHNMLFAHDNQKLIILERISINNGYQVGFNRLKNLNVTYIDANIAVYPVDFSGPSIMAYNSIMEKYTKENGLLPPDRVYSEKKYYNKCFKKYFKAYQKKYKYQWYVMDWYIKNNHIEYIYEAYVDGVNYFGEYIKGSKPIYFYQYFQWNYIKQLIKTFIRKEI